MMRKFTYLLLMISGLIVNSASFAERVTATEFVAAVEHMMVVCPSDAADETAFRKKINGNLRSHNYEALLQTEKYKQARELLRKEQTKATPADVKNLCVTLAAWKKELPAIKIKDE
jgi:hypothetical protein